KSENGKNGVIWSGSAVVDHNNSLGKNTKDTKAIVAFFTHTANPMHQCAAYSLDRGRTFTLINGGNAIVPNQGIWKGERDPKVFWHEKSKKWVMAVIVAGPDKLVRIWHSDDLVNWKKAGDFSRHFVECFDMYELPVDGDSSNTRWVCNDAAFYYQIGDFDGSVFTSDNKMLLGDWGGRRFFKAFYASQTFNNSPDGKVYQIAWMKGSGKNDPFKKQNLPFTQQMTFPCELSLKDTAEGIRLCRWPIDGIKSLYHKSHTFSDLQNTEEVNKKTSAIKADLVDMQVEFTPPAKGLVTFNIRGLDITYGHSTSFPNKEGKNIKVKSIQFTDEYGGRDTINIPAPTVDGKVSLRILLDRLSVELFVNNGVYAAASYCMPTNDKIKVAYSEGNDLTMNKIQIHELKSIWK
ncbi:MAG: glycoside hydrolase family 32 protein, partial [Planctomycetes bacterium]|nr:glycoside hydrolase family 32 protein [Planctomycetota bacterium]